MFIFTLKNVLSQKGSLQVDGELNDLCKYGNFANLLTLIRFVRFKLKFLISKTYMGLNGIFYKL